MISLLVRASQNRLINRPSRYSEKPKEKLWKFMQNQSSKGKIVIEIPSRGGDTGNLFVRLVISLWRGWKRLCDLTDGWEIAKAS